MSYQNAQGCSQLALRQDVTFEAAEGHPRTARVFIPPSYHSQPNRKFPLLFMQDGQNLFDRETAFLGQSWKLGSTILNQLCANTIDEFIVVGLDNSGFNRVDEYTPWRDDEHQRGGGADRYLDTYEHHILPALKRQYRIHDDPKQNVIAGSSLGAVLSLYTLIKRPHLFGGAMLMSGTWWWQNHSMHELVRNWKPAAHTRVWIDTGDSEPLRDDILAMRDTLKSVGLSEDNGTLGFHEAQGGQHNEHSWGARMHLPLKHFFPRNDKPNH